MFHVAVGVLLFVIAADGLAHVKINYIEMFYPRRHVRPGIFSAQTDPHPGLIQLIKDGGHGSENSLPRFCDNPEIAKYLAKMCEPYGTKIVRDEDGMLHCEW